MNKEERRIYDKLRRSTSEYKEWARLRALKRRREDPEWRKKQNLSSVKSHIKNCYKLCIGYTERNKKYAKNNPIRVKCYTKVYRAIKNGTIIKPKFCDRCLLFSTRIVAHHKDYSLPLEVEWLCESCHRLEHSSIKTLDII